VRTLCNKTVLFYFYFSFIAVVRTTLLIEIFNSTHIVVARIFAAKGALVAW